MTAWKADPAGSCGRLSGSLFKFNLKLALTDGRRGRVLGEGHNRLAGGLLVAVRWLLNTCHSPPEKLSREGVDMRHGQKPACSGERTLAFVVANTAVKRFHSCDRITAVIFKFVSPARVCMRTARFQTRMPPSTGILPP